MTVLVTNAVTQGRPGVNQRERRDPEGPFVPGLERCPRWLELKNARVLVQVIAPGGIIGAVHRYPVAGAPAQMKQPHHMVHMVMGQQDALKTPGGEDFTQVG